MLWIYILFLIFILLHIICCVLIWLGIQAGLIKVRKIMVPVAFFLPVWGELAVLILHFQLWIKETDKKEIGVERFEVESELYKKISQEAVRTSGSTVSMEEALIVNTPKERRALIMDILNDNPKAYIDFLKMAGNNDDTEVVHYAVTAMVQISKENDRLLWEFERQYSENPDDLDTLTPYCDFLWKCLEQGLMQGQVEKMNRNLFDTLIQRKIRLDKPSATDYIRAVENSLYLKNYTAANALLDTASDIFPNNEELLILKIQSLAEVGRIDGIRELLMRIEDKDIYLTAKAREVIAFWKN